MNLFTFNAFVICAALLHVIAQPAGATRPRQALDASAAPDAYAIYGSVLQRAWKDRTDALLLQKETESNEALMGCTGFLPRVTGEWAEVAADVQRQNTHERTLQRALRMNIEYRLIARAEIQADDKRLARKYPGRWMRRPESLEYAAVSLIGFNRDRTKAMVYVRTRMSGGIARLELKGADWVEAAGEVCHWIA